MINIYMHHDELGHAYGLINLFVCEKSMNDKNKAQKIPIEI